MTPAEKRAKALDYAKSVNAGRLLIADVIEVADHWLSGYRAGYRDRSEEFAKRESARIIKLNLVQESPKP